MARVLHSTDQNIAKLRKAELMLVDGKSIDDVVKDLKVTKNTYTRMPSKRFQSPCARFFETAHPACGYWRPDLSWKTRF